VKAALAGLDMDQPGDDNFFSDPLKQAVQDGKVPQARLDEMVHRIVRSMFANGVIDQPPMPRSVVDPFRGRDDAQKIEEESIVLLQNTGGILPLAAAKTKSIAMIGGHADVGVLSGGGSAQVDAPGGNAIDPSRAARRGERQSTSLPRRCGISVSRPRRTRRLHTTRAPIRRRRRRPRHPRRWRLCL
jgi:beta-glucosidase